MLDQGTQPYDLQQLLFEDWGRSLKQFDQSIKRGFKKTGKWINTKAVKGFNDVMDSLEENDQKMVQQHRKDRMGQIQAATFVANYAGEPERAQEIADGST